MFLILSKQTNFPKLIRVGDGKPDAIACWNTYEQALAFLNAEGVDSNFEILDIDNIGFDRVAALRGLPRDQVRYCIVE